MRHMFISCISIFLGSFCMGGTRGNRSQSHRSAYRHIMSQTTSCHVVALQPTTCSPHTANMDLIRAMVQVASHDPPHRAQQAMLHAQQGLRASTGPQLRICHLQLPT